MSAAGPRFPPQAHGLPSSTRATVPQPQQRRVEGRADKETSLTPSRPLTSPTPSGCSVAAAPSLPSLSPLDKHFHQIEFRRIAGHWRLYTARQNFPEKDATILVFDRRQNVKAPPRIGRISRLALTDLLKYELTQLQALAHPRILHMMHPIEETKELLGFGSEALHCGLEEAVTVEGIDRLEMKLGVLQLIDGVSYLHNSAKMLHGNLTPSAVFVTQQRMWKIAGFSFSVAAKEPNTFPCYPYTKKLPPQLQPDLDFLAPEYLHPGQTHVSAAADVFSLGVLICWIYAGGKRLIDAKNNLETHAIICGQLDAALNLIASDLGSNLKESLHKVLSMDVDQRPHVQLLALIKHFDDPSLSALRQLDDIAQEFDPATKTHFISTSLYNTLEHIPEQLWFTRILTRFNEHLFDSVELFPALAKPLFYMLEHCESHNIHRLRVWIRRLLDQVDANKTLRSLIVERMSILFRRLADEKVEDKILDMIAHGVKTDDASVQSTTLRGIPAIADFLPLQFITRRLLPAVHTLAPYLNDNVPRQLDLLASLSSLSDRCDSASLPALLAAVSLCSSTHPVIVHAKSRLMQRLVVRDVSRLRDSQLLCAHLLHPLVAGISNQELSPAHFDDVMSSIRILLDIVEQLRYESDDREHKELQVGGGGGLSRMGSRRVSMSSTNLPRVMISAARPSFSGDQGYLVMCSSPSLCSFRKMSFLSADGRLEDRGRRESRDSRGSLESDMSIRIGNGSDVSEESSHSQRGRRQSWLEHYMHSCSLEQGTTLEARNMDGRSMSAIARHRGSERRARTRSPTDEAPPQRSQSRIEPARPNSFSNLGHNLVLTYRNLWQKDPRHG